MQRSLPDHRLAGSPLPRSVAVVVFALAALAAIAWVFWDQDVRYSLPTPTPAGLRQPALGTTVNLPPSLALPPGSDARPLLLHFYNPDCPCSRFNRDHVAGLLKRHGERVTFVAVLEHDAAHADEDSGLDLPHLVDAHGELAALLGVYSTPQAVLLDSERRLVFRGNYNTSRYCSDPGTEFVRLAIEALLDGRTYEPPAAAMVSYGCELPEEPPR